MSLQGPDRRQEELLWTALSLLALLFIIAVGVGIAWVLLQVLNRLDDVLIPVAIAVILAYLLHPLVNLLERLRLKREVAVLLLFALVGGGFATVSMVLAPKLYQEAKLLVQALPDWETQIGARIDGFLEDKGTTLGVPLNHVTDLANAHLKAAGTQLATMSGLSRLLQTVGFALGLVFVPFYLFYFLADQPKIAQSWKDYLPLRDSMVRREIVVIVEQINKYLVSFFRGQIVVAAIDGILIMIGLAAIGVNYALLIGAAACLLTIIPYFGILTVCLLTFLVAGFQGGGGFHLVALSLGVFAVVQTLENTLISPRVMNQQTGLHPVTVLLSILIWSSLLGGLLGAILAVPLTATLKVLMARYALIKGNPGDALSKSA